MTVLDDSVQPWAPGARRSRRFVPVALPSGTNPGVRVDVSLADGERTIEPEVVTSGSVVRLTVPPARERAVLVHVPASDVIALWRPGSGQDRGRIEPSWVDHVETGPFFGPCIGSLVTRGDRAAATFGAVAGAASIRVRTGMVEETAELMVAFETDAEESLTVVLDLGGDDFSASVRRIGQQVGLVREPVSPANEAPVLCSWYAFHQDLDQARLLDEGALAGRLGFGTLIIDDGWQTADTARGYASCGDWLVDPSKIPDPASLVRQLEQYGLRTMWWIGTPFVGYRSDAYRNGGVRTLADDPDMEAAVFDPRSVAARSHLVERCKLLLERTGADGLKLDFLERFGVAADDRLPADADSADPQAAALELLDELNRALAAVRDDTMIEFREPYLSTSTISRATMMRVADCPLSPIQNRLGVIDLRLMTQGIAIHSDPIMWSSADSPERVAQHLLSGLFGVPQVSVEIGALAQAQYEALAFWLGFWRTHSGLLLHGELTAFGVEQDYSVVEGRKGRLVVSARYGRAPVTVPSGTWKEWHLANAEEDGVIVHGGTDRYDVTIRDCRGRVVSEHKGVDLALHQLQVPAGGLATIVALG